MKTKIGFIAFGLVLVGSALMAARTDFWPTPSSHRIFSLTSYEASIQNALNVYVVDDADGDANSGFSIASGTKTTKLLHGSVTVANGQTSNTLTLTGATSATDVVATINGGNTNGVFITAAIPGTDEVDVRLSGDPGANTDVSVWAFE